MADIIRLLPDSVANQIAAGEVIQRPASAVKEMLENSVDAGAGHIRLIIRDAGKSLIQVIDDGIGMSDTDARLCFERHATSKIRKADDLYSLHTMGFRGEALASIAGIAQVELKTRVRGSETGTRILIEGCECKLQEPCVMQEGTSLSVKNLFFNIPARRNFLKSNPVETRHILEEFTRVAMAYPHIHFTFHHNDLQVYDLRAGNFRQRISAVAGSSYNERLVPVEEETSILKVEGFVGKPEFSKRNRGEQYFFVNNRFIRDNYLHHAVNAAFESLIPKDCYPSYWLRISMNPASIDVNIHPTKTEIKFEDEKSVYAILRASVKRALGKFSISPSLDFDQERSFDIPLDKMNSIPVEPVVRVNPEYNPFHPQPSGNGNLKYKDDQVSIRNWNTLHELIRDEPVSTSSQVSLSLKAMIDELDRERFIQSGPRLLQIPYTQGLILIDLPGAHERILYEQLVQALENRPAVSQQQLFPPRLELSPEDILLVQELHDDLRKTGFDLTDFGNNSIVIQGVPAGIEAGKEIEILKQMLGQYRINHEKYQLDSHENLCRSMARSMAVKPGRTFASEELRQITLDLMHCRQPFYTVTGRPVMVIKTAEELLKLILPERL